MKRAPKIYDKIIQIQPLDSNVLCIGMRNELSAYHCHKMSIWQCLACGVILTKYSFFFGMRNISSNKKETKYSSLYLNATTSVFTENN